jgi:hypothetical protein
MRRRAADGAAGTRDIEEGKGGLQGFMDSAGGSWTFKIILSITALVALAMLTMSQSLQSGPSGASRGMQAATTQLIPPELGVNTSPKGESSPRPCRSEGVLCPAAKGCTQSCFSECWICVADATSMRSIHVRGLASDVSCVITRPSVV